MPTQRGQGQLYLNFTGLYDVKTYHTAKQIFTTMKSDIYLTYVIR